MVSDKNYSKNWTSVRIGLSTIQWRFEYCSCSQTNMLLQSDLATQSTYEQTISATWIFLIQRRGLAWLVHRLKTVYPAYKNLWEVRCSKNQCLPVQYGPATKQVDEKDTCSEDVIRKFRTPLRSKNQRCEWKCKFNKRVQGDESFDCFLIDLQQLVISCDYQDQDWQVRDLLIAGLHVEKLKEKISSWQTLISIKL